MLGFLRLEILRHWLDLKKIETLEKEEYQFREEFQLKETVVSVVVGSHDILRQVFFLGSV